MRISLGILHIECRPAYHQLCQQLTDQNVRLRIDGESIDLIFREDQVLVVTPEEDLTPDTQVETSWLTILDLTEARMGLDRAVLSNAVAIKGEVAMVAQFYEGLHIYLSGAVRCPSFPLLLDHFRSVYELSKL